jgi:O-antigen/teichoic acid export membrane protein
VLVGLILARLLTPEDFGLAALTLTFSALALVLSDPSLTARLVQRRDITEADRSTVFWATLAAGILCTGAGVALSWPIAAFYGEAALQPLLAVESATFLLVSLSATQVALMTREMSFRELELRDMAGTAIGGLAAVGAAFLGAGVWAIVIQSIVSAAIATLLLWRFSVWRPRRLFSWSSLRDSGSFGLKLFASRLLSFLNLNADNLLVGRHLGSTALGFYSIAYNVMYAPLLRVTAPIQNVMVPAFSRLQDERERLGNAWLRGAAVSAAIAMPAYLGMLAVAPDFVPVVLGERWADAVPVLQLLCICGILQGIQMLQTPLLQARGRAGSLLRYHLVATPVNIAGFAIGLQWGIAGVAAGFAVARALMVPVITRMSCREVGLPLSAFPRAIGRYALGAVLMCAVVVAARAGLVELGVPATARLAIMVVIGAGTYAGYVALRAPELIDELRSLRSG